MNSTSFTRRITAAMSAPLVAAGIMLGSMVIGDPATAGANLMAGGHATGMIPVH